MADDLKRLIEGVVPSSVGVELTSRCNLRCQYCSVPHAPAYGAEDLRADFMSKSLELLRGVPLQSLSLSGRGEISYAEHWPSVLRRYQELPVPTQLISNLAIPLSWEQACALASIDALGFSVDTLDRDLLRRVRKGADLRNIIANMGMLKAAAVHIGKAQLNFDLFSVVTVATVSSLSTVAAFAVAMGAGTWHLQDLVMDYSDLAEEVDTRHLSVLSPAEMKQAAADIDRARTIAEAGGVRVDIWPPFEAFLNGAPVESSEITSAHLGRHRRHAIPLKPGETRDCFQPWDYVLLMANGGAEPCCGGYGAIGSYTDANSIEEVANGEGFQALRRELLSGDLSELCRKCSLRAPIDITEFRAKVEHLMLRPSASAVIPGASVENIRRRSDFDRLDPKRPVYIYGTGRGGHIARDAIIKFTGIAPVGFVSTSGGAPFLGLPLSLIHI